MAFESENLIQISAGEGSPDQLGGQKVMGYESTTDPLANVPGGMLEPGYFNSLAKNVRIGSFFILTYSGITEVYKVISDNPSVDVVVLSLAVTNVPSPSYTTLAEAPVEFVTAGGDTDTFPYADSLVGNYANYSLNSEVLVTGPPGSSSGIQFVECQAGQIFVKWLRPAVAGQTVKIWLQVRSATPSP